VNTSGAEVAAAKATSETKAHALKVHAIIPALLQNIYSKK
jgi:hypothetical protein